MSEEPEREETTREVVLQFQDALRSVVGFYFDSSMAYHSALERLKSAREQFRATLATNDPDIATHERLDSLPFSYTEGEPGLPDTLLLHESTQKEVRERFEAQGQNPKMLGNLCVVMIYQYWEDHFRGKIAKSMGKEKNDIISPIMGDIRNIRNSIIHRGGKAVEAVEKNLVLQGLKRDQIIFIDDRMFKLIIGFIGNFLVSLEPSLETNPPSTPMLVIRNLD